jgi:hypothetical protein
VDSRSVVSTYRVAFIHHCSGPFLDASGRLLVLTFPFQGQVSDESLQDAAVILNSVSTFAFNSLPPELGQSAYDPVTTTTDSQ